MKTIRLLVTAVVSLTMCLVYADTWTDPDTGYTWNYLINGNTAEVSISASTTAGAIMIPAILDGKTVTSIGERAFNHRTGLTGVTIPNSVTSIGYMAFHYCIGLKNVTIPNSVTNIGEWAFYNCSGLTSVTIPDSVTSIGEAAFFGTPFYDKQPDGLVIFGKVLYAMKGACPGRVTIPDSVTSIARGAFKHCYVTSVTIGNGVTNIGYQAFRGCSGLTSVTIPYSVTSIGDGAFLYCGGLTSVTIPDSVTSIGDSAFLECSELTSVTIVATGKPGASAENVKQAMIVAGVDPNITWKM